MNQNEIEKLITISYSGKKLIKLLEGGMSFAYEIDNKIIRIPKNDFSKAGYVREEKILNYLQQIVTCTHLPDVQIIREPFFHTVHNKISGFYWNEKQYYLRSEKDKDALAEDCAMFFTQLHSADITKIDAELPEIPSIQEDLEKHLCHIFTANEIEEILNFTEPLYSLQQKVLVHKDFYYDNFLLNNDYRLNGVLDFGNSGLYTYMYDFKYLANRDGGMHDLFTRLAPRYTSFSGRVLDLETIRRVDIHNYINFLAYFTKNKDIKDEKINAMGNLDKHVNSIKEKMKRYVR